MRMRLFPGMALLCLIAVPTAARPAPAPAPEPKGPKPGFVVRMQSIDELMVNFEYLAALAGKDNEAKQIKGLLKSMTGPKGLEGLDTKRPVGLYGDIGPNGIDTTPVLLLPVRDEKAVLDLLGRLNFKVEKDKNDVYSFTPDNLPVTIYFRFASKHAYVTFGSDSVLARDKLLDPAKVLPANADPNKVVSATFRIDQVPDNLKQIAIQQFDLAIADLKDQRGPDENDAQLQIKRQVLDEVSAQVLAVLKEGGDVQLDFSIDRKSNDLTAELSLTGKEDSKLAGVLYGLGKSKSRFGSLGGKDSAASGLLHVGLTDNLSKAWAGAIDELIRQTLDKEPDKDKRERLAQIAKTLGPALKVEEVDAGFDLRGPSKDKKYTIVLGHNVKDGSAAEKAFLELVKELPAEYRDGFQANVDKAGKVRIHSMALPKDTDPKVKQVFGEGPVYLAFRPDGVLLALGEDGKGLLKEALTAPAKEAPAFRFEASVTQLAPLMAARNKAAPKAAELVFTEPGSDKVRLVVQGGKALKLRLEMKAQVVQFFSQLKELNGDK